MKHRCVTHLYALFFMKQNYEMQYKSATQGTMIKNKQHGKKMFQNNL